MDLRSSGRGYLEDCQLHMLQISLLHYSNIEEQSVIQFSIYVTAGVSKMKLNTMSNSISYFCRSIAQQVYLPPW